MRVEGTAATAQNRGARKTAGGLPGGGQRSIELGPAALGGYHPLFSVHGGNTASSDYSCVPTPENSVSGGEGDHQAANLPGGHLWGVGQTAVS